MQLIKPAGRLYIQCEKCRTSVVWPVGISESLAVEFAAIARSNSLKGMKFAHEVLGLNSREVKALSLHVTRPAGHCHKCGKPVLKGESVCSCRSANIDW
jgi:endogenous inhibitor of DNA gyrase (YacG/DUF329 family)